MVTRRSSDEIAVMRRAGRVVAEMHEACRSVTRPGVTTLDLDRAARAVLERRGAQSNFLGYHGFPAVICASVNDEIVHGIPGARVLEEGDIVSIDCGAIVDGWHGDAAFTMGVGRISPDDEALIETTRRSLEAAIDTMIEGHTIGDIGHAVESTVAPAGYAVLRDYTGHGIGRAMHEAPDVPNHGSPGRGRRLRGRDGAGRRAHGGGRRPRGGRARRRLDRGHRRRRRRRPLGAHHRRHRRRPRDPDPSLIPRT